MLTNSALAASFVDPSHRQQVLALMVGKHPDAICDVTIDLWERLAKSLAAIIGNEGFEALYDRSVHLAGATFPWLAPAGPPFTDHSRFVRLKSGLQGRDPDEASRAAVLLLATFIGSLSTLIGQHLTTNILRAAWGDAFEDAAKEISQWPTK